MDNFGEIECSVTVEVLNSAGFMAKRSSYNQVSVSLGRDQFRDVYLKVGSSGKFLMKDVKVLSRFAKEGKATIQMLCSRKNILLWNCPPGKLKGFLQLLSVKLHLKKSFASSHMRLFSEKPAVFEEISPVTEHDIRACQGQHAMVSPVSTVVGCPQRMNGFTSISTKRPASTDGGVEILCKKPRRIEAELGKVSDDAGCVLRTSDVVREVQFRPQMTPIQEEIVRCVKSGANIFFTGGAGTGKSFLIKRIIGVLPPDCTVASASTGIAACQIGGVTLHAFAGIGSGDAPVEKCIELASRPSVAASWRKCKTLIIDEISMVDAGLFDKLEQVARAVRNNNSPFGGIQLVLCGDFLQLPPVAKKEGERRFCFKAREWIEADSAKFEKFFVGAWINNFLSSPAAAVSWSCTV